jgi:hypothetical protein
MTLKLKKRASLRTYIECKLVMQAGDAIARKDNYH